MSSTLERHVVTVGGLRVGDGPAVVIDRRISLRGLDGMAGMAGASGASGSGRSGGATGWDRVEARRDGVTLVEPGSAADLPAIAGAADGVVIGAAWTRDIPLVRAVAGLGLPVVVERRASATLEEWLGLADYCALECEDRVILCETGRLDLGLLRAARAASGRPVLADVSADLGLSAAAVAAGADGLIVARPPANGPVGGTGDARRTEEHDVRLAEEAVALVGALVRPERPATLPECRQAIDRVDAALATLLERRAELAGIVQTLKPVGGFAGRDMARERALVARMAEHAPELGEARLVPIMNAVIEAGLSLAEERSANGRSSQPEATA
ncbi:chorismate mutase [Nonomuraea sp. NPDC050680]|uniref:chorismate mutase n=1 Tax=Nonomuraea sp. NPDC050680 TaxID=3154630 RepID=UPI0033E2B3D4